jgi:hypothetical protein
LGSLAGDYSFSVFASLGADVFASLAANASTDTHLMPRLEQFAAGMAVDALAARDAKTSAPRDAKTEKE